VSARYGLADLDSAGEWVPTGDLGLVWKPAVADGWAPYQRGRWRYFEALGYTWVSDDPWGWLPYHNGRWARIDNLGWVWQPAVTAVFHPGEVYWLHGASLAGWGPLAPGELWTAPNPGATAPQFFTKGNTTFAMFQPDVRAVDPTGFPAPSLDQLKGAVFVPALPSPAFLVSRLDATRPVLKVGSTRVMPSVPGVTFGDTTATEPPSDIMTNPADDPGPAPAVVSDASADATPPPDGVYPVPVAAVPVVAVPVLINPPDHPNYSRPTTSTQPAVGATAAPSRTPPASQPGGNQPVRVRPPETAPGTPTPVSRGPAVPPVRERPAPVVATPPASATPPAATPPAAPRPNPPAPSPAAPPAAPRIEPPKIEPPKPGDKKAAVPAPVEVEIYRQVLQDVDPAAPNYAKALADLNTWTRQFPSSAFENDRLYYYIHTYNGAGRADKVLDTAVPLVSAGVGNSFRDQQQVLQVLVAASASVRKLPKPTAQQAATGRRAAQELLSFLPDYFSPRHKPAEVSDAAWSMARTQLETVAKEALARRPVAVAASK
jgi:hypothetical protein